MHVRARKIISSIRGRQAKIYFFTIAFLHSQIRTIDWTNIFFDAFFSSDENDRQFQHLQIYTYISII